MFKARNENEDLKVHETRNFVSNKISHSKSICKHFLAYFTNARSLRNKFRELVSNIIVYKFDLLCICESWINKINHDLLQEYEIQGYKMYTYQRGDRQGGGVIIYVKENIKVHYLDNFKSLCRINMVRFAK